MGFREFGRFSEINETLKSKKEPLVHHGESEFDVAHALERNVAGVINEIEPEIIGGAVPAPLQAKVEVVARPTEQGAKKVGGYTAREQQNALNHGVTRLPKGR